MFRLIAKSHNSNYEEGCRNHNRIWECNLHNRYLLKISLSESVSSQSFSWRRETLWHLDFMVYVFLSMWICHNHNHKIMFVTNPNSYGQNLFILNFLPSRVPPLLPSYLAAHLCQSMYFHWTRCLPLCNLLRTRRTHMHNHSTGLAQK